MKAKVTKVEYGVVTVKVNRSIDVRKLDRSHFDLKVGDLVEVKRRTNNPYLIRVV